MKAYADDRATAKFVPSFTKTTKIYAKINKATLEDSYININSEINKEFFSVDRIQNDVGSLSYDKYIEAAIFLDPNKDTYYRKVFTIMDLFFRL